MKLKQIVILAVIFGILALGILLKSWVRSVKDDDRWAKGYVTKTYFFSPSEVENILIGRGVKAPPVELTKENGVWAVKSLWNVKADPGKVSDFLERLLKAMQEQEFRGKGKNLFPDFGITDQEAFFIKLTEPHNPPVDLRLGTQKAGEGYFVRRAGDDSVYFTGENLAELLGIFAPFEEGVPAGDFWADLSLFNLNPEKVTKIVLYRSKGEEKIMAAGLERETDSKDPRQSSWKFLRQDMSLLADPDKVLKFIVMMNSVRAQKVADPSGKGYGLEEPVWQLAVTEGGRETVLSAGPKDEKQGFCYVRRAGDKTVFVLNDYFFNDLNVDDTYFLKDAPPAAESKKAS